MRTAPLLLAAALLAAPFPTFAQQTTNDIVYGSDDTSEREGDGNSRLGLLGLLGLAGLLGLMRREPDIHVDARRGSAADER